MIDRFGRVYRIVRESDAAEHAGYSVWSDDAWLYLNLNESFLGISFETKTEPGQEQPTVSPAQIHAAAVLTEMLRGRYGISAGNCVAKRMAHFHSARRLIRGPTANTGSIGLSVAKNFLVLTLTDTKGNIWSRGTLP